MEEIISFEELLSLNGKDVFDCDDFVTKTEKEVYSIGNSYIPDHELIYKIPREHLSHYKSKKAKVRIHIIWLFKNSANRYAGIVIDKTDLKLYFVDVFTGDSDTSGNCSFSPIDSEYILSVAKARNQYLNEVAELVETDKAKLLDYQIYSPFTEKFCYMEFFFEDKVVLCGVGLNLNTLLAVGWLGKLINKNFFVSYAECSFETYEQIKNETPSFYQRSQLMEKNSSAFSYFKVFVDKRKNFSNLVKLLTDSKKESFSSRKAVYFWADAWGTHMKEYSGVAPRWMEDFLLELRKKLD